MSANSDPSLMISFSMGINLSSYLFIFLTALTPYQGLIFFYFKRLILLRLIAQTLICRSEHDLIQFDSKENRT